MENQNLPRVVKIKSSTPVAYLDAFDMMSRFLAAEKAKQISLDFVGDAYLTSATQTWDDLRLSCNSIRDENSLPREPVPAWKVDDGETADIDGNVPSSDMKSPMTPGDDSNDSDSSDSEKKRSAKKSAKKEKKAAKKAKKAAKKAKKAAKKAKKEAKKRKSGAAI